MKDEPKQTEKPEPKVTKQPRRSYLFWANVFVLLPFAFLVARATSTNNGIYLFWAFMISPAALVTLGLDIYTALQNRKNKKNSI
ncbi:hypothetical protein EYC59_01030 [Candidatus Saccharibacteria bacterium]|nr:MAG: hypothetical protein EYC59_01030 [Candidatus Saccharibacteria bacterium]